MCSINQQGMTRDVFLDMQLSCEQDSWWELHYPAMVAYWVDEDEDVTAKGPVGPCNT